MVVLPATKYVMDGRISAREFAVCMEALGPFLPDVPEAPMAVAVSGGADSMALAWLMRRWRRHVVAFVVDHGLRVEAAAEAALTEERLGKMGIEAQVLRLAPFPSGRVQERARAARFAALEAACVERGCVDVVLGHHQHDQDETIWMRRERVGAAPVSVGLRGMAAEVLRGRVRVLRPLLSFPPERMRATLRAESLPWVEDPSNQNRRFERVRWRQDLTGGMREEARMLQRESQSVNVAYAQSLAVCMARSVVWHPAGWCHVLLDSIGSRELMAQLLAELIRMVAGGAYRPARDAVERLVTRGEGTLGGVVLRRAGRFGDGIIMFREERAVAGAVPAVSGVLWDGRWIVPESSAPEEADGAVAGLYIAKLGDHAARFDARHLGMPSAALRVLPGLYRGDCLLRVPVWCGGDLALIWSSGGPIT
ncbi:tRNA lysidine(34) synthetase TilS [Neokomagataea thailandica]|uniref:tRNA lysidine(34) synthetase TilS n=1 Tax=Neokomagataea TaxID=1223423 RepID=UPI001FE21EE5|nr:MULTISPECIES: tRNA lysidine(34) synthetase TilS [Neokomagataea]